MIKTRLVPVYFDSKENKKFKKSLKKLKELLQKEVEFLEPISLAESPPEADAVVFPRLIGDIYSKYELLKAFNLPVLIVTSEFGTMAMWDWEIVTFLKAKGIEIFAPYNLNLTLMICRALRLKREMRDTTFLIYQDDPGDGMQASIFKRFYWWEDDCRNLIKEKFGIKIIEKSYKELGEKAKNISDQRAERELKKKEINTVNLPHENLLASLKLYLQIRDDIKEHKNVKAVGANCLNESYFSDTTPCLAWNLLFEEDEIIWGCEGDLLSLLSEFIFYKALKKPMFMSNIYPFLMGDAALKHERISAFPEVEEPENHVLVAHCGYLGVLPQSFACKWSLKPGVLEIIENNSVAIDARIDKGGITMAKLHHSLDKYLICEGNLEGYTQYPNSDCKNGALIKVKDGKEFMDRVYSHHQIFIKGSNEYELKLLAKILDLKFEIL